MTNVGGVTVFGATYPAQIWRKFMLDATGPLPPLDFAAPDAAPFIRSRFISELGRRISYRSQSSQNFTSTTVPTSATSIAPPPPPPGSPVSTPNKKKQDTPPPTVSPTVPPNRP